MLGKTDTIFAMSTAAGRAAIAVIRVSGPHAGVALEQLRERPLPEPRRATYARLKDPRTGKLLDEGLVLWFPGPNSETGEDVVELQIHGGRATTAAVLAALAQVDGLRPALAGEFARRAFENGKLDLTAVEGLADLVDAETEAQRLQALRQLKGELGRLYESWRARLIRVLAHAEAAIEFADEVAEEEPTQCIVSGILWLKDEITQHLDDQQRGQRLREGLSIAILGAPNVGKSSLLNVLAKRDVAIVSERAGTTRDVIEVHLDLAGYPVLLADTAGIRESGDEIELEGVRRAKARAEDADLRVILLDATIWPEVPEAVRSIISGSSLVVLNKVDLRDPRGEISLDGKIVLKISAWTGQGIETLVKTLEQEAISRIGICEVPALTRIRHRQALENCLTALRRAGEASLPELVAEDLRLATRELGRITGRVDVEDLLDVIFRDFCIGK